MNRYENGKIYKITDIDYTECYIGSTCESLSQRMARHRVKFNHYLNGQKLDLTSTRLFEKYGLENCKIELIEHYPCNSKEELLKREGEYIRNTDCVNRYIAGRTRAEWIEEHKEQYEECIKKWYRNNEELTKQRAKEHKENNMEHYKEVKKKYREEHKEDLKQKNSEYYHQNKEQLSEKRKEQINCECGATIRKTDLKRHFKTTKHKTLIQELNKSSE